MKKIVLTGGGTAGHVTPNIALLPALFDAGYEVEYIGSYGGMERELIEAEGIPYHGIASGKLRRYFSLKNFTDPFRVLKGYTQAKKLLRQVKPDVLFSKGGFVSVPVVLAAHARHIPVIIHESDMTPGLANRIAFRGATKICCSFPETLPFLPEDKRVLTGSPIRRQLLLGSAEEGRTMCGFSDETQPILLIIGGSSGAAAINEAVRGILPHLLARFYVIHLCGKGNVDEALTDTAGYMQYEYVSDPLADLFAAADLVISRAGANCICELLALRKPNILIPLGTAGSRGDQILNARSFEEQGFSRVLPQEEIQKEGGGEVLFKAVCETYKNRQTYIDAMAKSGQQDAVSAILSLIEEVSGT